MHVPPPEPPAAAPRPPAARDSGSYSMCYAISTGEDPFGGYHRYEFVRPLFPDYPRPAVWPGGYYVPTSTGDDVIEKHACVVDRQRMLRGEGATEQCFIIDSVNFLNNADLDGTALSPAGAPDVMLATGGTQLRGDLDDDANAPDSSYRWMPSPAIDAAGNILIGYSFGGSPHFAGQRVAGRLAGDPPGRLTTREAILASGEAAQTGTLRWQDYTQTAVDPLDDCTIWYVGDYMRKGATNYSTRIGAWRLEGCPR
ncbi:MAG: hypothetical protein ACT4OZ_02815 [Gemmatimonadota bacterium]